MKTQEAKKRQIHIVDKNGMHIVIRYSMKMTKFRSMAIQMLQMTFLRPCPTR